MRHNIQSWFWLPLLAILTACGQDVAQVYERNLYHTQDFASNYYQNTLLSTTLGSDFYSNEAPAIISINSNAIRRTIPQSSSDIFGNQFALDQKMSRLMPSLGYGIESKLFDGILYCTDAQRLSKSRLQLLPSGMGYAFPSKLIDSTTDTIGLFMKAGADTNQQGQHIRALTVTLTLFKASPWGWLRTIIYLTIEDLVQTAFPGYYEFSLASNILTGTEAFGFTYEIIHPLPPVGGESLTGVFLYEVLFPGSNWN
jgi:hypothetical protein